MGSQRRPYGQLQQKEESGEEGGELNATAAATAATATSSTSASSATTDTTDTSIEKIRERIRQNAASVAPEGTELLIYNAAKEGDIANPT